MPSIPPFSRRAKIYDYSNDCLPIIWSEEKIKAADGTKLSLAIGMHGDDEQKSKSQRLVIAYFQGNAGSLPSRLPSLSENLLRIRSVLRNHHPIIVALSYRGFWSSSGRPTQQGIEQDSAAFLAWLLSVYTADSALILWGQSIGSGIMVNAVAQLLRDNNHRSMGRRRIKGLILETPFISIREMLKSIYPQRFLPYQYLWPFLTSHWDTEIALRSIQESIYRRPLDQTVVVSHGQVHKLTPEILILQAEKDELVPESHARHLAHLCSELSLAHKLHVVPGSLHTESFIKRNGQEQISLFVKSCLGY